MFPIHICDTDGQSSAVKNHKYIYHRIHVMCVHVRTDLWGSSSDGRAPASHAGGIGIDARVLHFLFFFPAAVGCVPKNFD